MLRQRLFDNIARNGSDDVLLSTVDEFSLTGETLDDRIRAAAKYLSDCGLKPGDRLVASLPNGVPFVLLYLACLWARVTVCPLNPDSSAPEVRYVLDVFRPDAAIGLDADVLNDGCKVLDWSLDFLRQLPTAEGANTPEWVLNDIFSVTFTSGTTGRPKAVVHYAERLLANAFDFNEFLGYTSSERMLHVMPMYYMAGLLNTILCPLAAGGSVVISQQFSPREALFFWKRIIDNDVTAFWLSPAMVHLAMSLDRNAGSGDYAKNRLNFAFCGTAPLPPEMFVQFEARYGVSLLQSYGLSELLLVSCNLPETAAAGSIGAVMPKVNCSFAQDGELLVETPYAFGGYLDPETGLLPSEQSVTSMPTGDFAAFDDKTRTLSVTGRKKDIIVVGGINVSPVAVENVLMTAEGVSQVAVIGEADAVYGERVAAYVALQPGRTQESTMPTLKALCAANLSAASQPSRYYFLDKLPAGPTGKIQKHALNSAGAQ